MIVGLTGKSCSGKNRAAELLDKDRFSVIDVDKLGHIALDANIDKIRNEFGADVISSDGHVDRKKLGPIVFASPEKLEKLNAITHPWMVEETLSQARGIEDEGRIAVINAAILEKMGFVEYCDEIVLILADLSVRAERAGLRDNIDEETFRKRAQAQKDIGASLFSSGKKVITIINNGPDDALSRQIKNYCASIKK